MARPQASTPHRRRCSCWSATARRRRPARCCPAAPRACTSPRRARSRPSAAAERIAAARAGSTRLRVAARAGPRDRRADRQGPRAARCSVDKGLLECDFGDWTGGELKKLMKLPEWNTVQRAPSTFRFPGRRELHRDADPDGRDASTGCAPRTRAASSSASPTPTRSRPPSPTPWAPTSTCSSASSSARARSRAIAYSRGGPVVLTVNSTGGSLAELRPS